MVKPYMIPVYGLLVKAGRMVIESTGEAREMDVSESYQIEVALYLAAQEA